MNAKMLEIRDWGTFIPMLAIQLEPSNEEDRWLLARAGYGRTAEAQGKYILLCRITGGADRCTTDPCHWGTIRTYSVAHAYIQQHWEELRSGSVVCVEHILGEREQPKTSERLTVPGDEEWA